MARLTQILKPEELTAETVGRIIWRQYTRQYDSIEWTQLSEEVRQVWVDLGSAVLGQLRSEGILG